MRRSRFARTYFNPRSPHGERRNSPFVCFRFSTFQSTLPARGATFRAAHRLSHGGISIHAPRTGSDGASPQRPPPSCHFNPRSPHGERPPGRMEDPMIYKFQSTLPARGATHGNHPVLRWNVFQSTLPARGATTARMLSRSRRHISIHAPRTGSDTWQDWQNEPDKAFQSTLPARGATTVSHRLYQCRPHFNPRSPHGERRCPSTSPPGRCNFNPRSPHGERPGTGGHHETKNTHFNPRSPHGERHTAQGDLDKETRISIHAPRTGSDAQMMTDTCWMDAFQSTLPARGATSRAHARNRRTPYFNPRSPHGERHYALTGGTTMPNFNPRSPHGERQPA